MSTILITGCNGFIGKNLSLFFAQNGHKVLGIDIDHTEESLLNALSQADFIVHLAGVNRSTSLEDFHKGNVDFTTHLLTCLEQLSKSIPIIVSSSTQALLDNPYGQSKKAMEDVVIAWAKRTHNKAFIFRLTNVFGKWCRPNYNSAVATFCYNLAHGIPLTISDPKKMLHLCYIDDIATSFLKIIESASSLETGFYEVMPILSLTLEELVQKLTAFSKNQNTLFMPNLEGHFNKALYATYLSYLEDDMRFYALNSHCDARGSLTELIKSHTFGQIFISSTKPGITRGNHWHHTKVEKFVVLQGQATIALRSILDTNIINYDVSGEKIQVIDIPPGYTHSITNTGTTDLITLFWASEVFDPSSPDTYYEEVHK
ncbi:MAG: SDR family oxidoreductase [Cellulosilyticum sp.]|nr:SDR family oxidoreductase [Cellulosilyticum sp.]